MRSIVLACVLSLLGASVASAQPFTAARDAAISGAAREKMVRHAPHPDACLTGFQWRQAGPNDRVCAPPTSRERVARENAEHLSHVEKTVVLNGLFRVELPTDRCLSGYMRREAFDNDGICVTPAAYGLAQTENSFGPSRRVRQ